MNIYETRNDLFKIFDKNLIIAELGVFKGEFSKFLYEELNPKELYLVDIFEGYVGSGDKDGNNMEYTNLQDEYASLVTFFNNNKNVKVLKTTTTEFLESIDDNYLDIVYIDADHDYEPIKKDLYLSFKKVKNGGFICGHDYTSPRFDGVVRAVNEFCDEMNLKINYLTNDGCPTFCIIKE
jgi:O-methyltransferase